MPQYALKQSQTSRHLFFLMIDSTDHVTGKTGLTPTVTLSKNGAAFAAAAGAVTELSSGWYKLAGNATDENTLGPLLLHATGTGADPLDAIFEVVAYDPDDTVRLGLTALPNVAAGANGGLPTGNASGQVVVSSTATGALTTASFAAGAINAAAIGADAITAAKVADGTIDAATFAAGAINAAAIATDAITAAKIAADAITAAKVADGTIDALTFAAGAIDAAAIAADAITAAKVADGTIDAATFAAGAINAAAIATDAITAAKIAADAIGASELAADAVTEIQSGLATSAALVTAQADLDDLQTRLPAALVSGRMDSSVGAMAANTLTATAIATDAITAAKIAADAIGASELAADAVTEIQSGLATSAALVTLQADTDDLQTRLPAALVSGRIDASVGAMAANTLTETAIAADAITAAKIAPDAIGASELAADAVTEIAAGVNAEVVDALAVDTYAEPGAVPASTATLAAKIGWLFALARNKISQTSTTQTLRNAADSGSIGTAAVSDDGSTFTRNNWS